MLLKKILYTDMDGTLLTDQKTVSQKNKDAILSYAQQGGIFSVATGRSEVIAKPFLKDLPILAPAILYNGAAVYDFKEERFLHRSCLPRPLVRAFYEAGLEVYPEVCIEVYTDGIIQLLNPNGVMDHYIPAENQPYTYATPDTMGECMKLLFYGENEKLHLVEKRLYELSGGKGFLSTFSAPYYLEILPAEASKGTALRWIIENCGWDPEQFTAIGDFYNDIEMLKAASLAASPSNAPEDVKIYADLIVSDNNHDALYDLIQNHLIV